MTISISCKCGRIINAADKYAGRKVRCPDCSDIIQVPAPPSTSKNIIVNCKCRKQLSVKPELSGKAVRCPSCENAIRIPISNSESSPLSTSNDSEKLFVKCSCGKQLAVKSELAGKAVRCPKCQKVVRIPSPKSESIPPSLNSATSPPQDDFLDDIFDDESDPLGDSVTVSNMATVKKRRTGRKRDTLDLKWIWWTLGGTAALLLMMVAIQTLSSLASNNTGTETAEKRRDSNTKNDDDLLAKATTGWMLTSNPRVEKMVRDGHHFRNVKAQDVVPGLLYLDVANNLYDDLVGERLGEANIGYVWGIMFTSGWVEGVARDRALEVFKKSKSIAEKLAVSYWFFGSYGGNPPSSITNQMVDVQSEGLRSSDSNVRIFACNFTRVLANRAEANRDLLKETASSPNNEVAKAAKDALPWLDRDQQAIELFEEEKARKALRDSKDVDVRGGALTFLALMYSVNKDKAKARTLISIQREFLESNDEELVLSGASATRHLKNLAEPNRDVLMRAVEKHRLGKIDRKVVQAWLSYEFTTN